MSVCVCVSVNRSFYHPVLGYPAQNYGLNSGYFPGLRAGELPMCIICTADLGLTMSRLSESAFCVLYTLSFDCQLC